MSERVAIVTGGAGFIGRATCAALAERGVTPIAADVAGPEGFEFRPLDVSDAEAVSSLVDELRPQIVVHLAALLGVDTQEQPSRAVQVNVMGTQHILDACVESPVERLVYASSIAVYGDQPDWGEQTVTEDDLGRPAFLYGWHKQLNEATARHYQRLYGLRAVGLRISTVYGEGRKVGMSAGINRLIESAAAGRGECALGPGTDSCLVHVADVGEQLAILATAEQPQHDVYNAGGDFSTIAELADLIAQERPDVEISLGPDRARLPHVSRVDGSRLREEFGFRPRSFEDWARTMLATPAPAGA
jgi:nucleoside-diphosphate-sugar epimerase